MRPSIAAKSMWVDYGPHSGGGQRGKSSVIFGEPRTVKIETMYSARLMSSSAPSASSERVIICNWAC